MKTFRDKVIEHRAALGLSQQQLADKAGIGVRTIGNYESGARLPYAAQLYKLAKALGCTFRINGAPFPRQRCKRLAPAVRYPFVVTC